MKICLATRCFDFRNAGIGRVSSEIRRVLVERGYDVAEVATETGMSLYRYYWYLTWQMRSRLPGDSDVYHALTPMEAMWPPKKKTVVTFHDLFLITEPGKVGGGLGYRDFKRDIGRKYFEQACRVAAKCRFVTCVSEKTKEEVMSYFKVPEEKITVIRSGINADLEPEPKPNGVPRIGYLGGLDKRKRVNLLIDAFMETKGNAQLLIGGTGLDENILKEQAKSDDRIKFLGIVSDKYLKDFYNSLDMLIFPTAQEGYGLPLIEIMACKKPPVILRDAQIPEEIKSRCVAVDNLAEAISCPARELLNDGQLESNYRFAKTHDWNKAVNEYIKLYKEIADE